IPVDAIQWKSIESTDLARVSRCDPGILFASDECIHVGDDPREIAKTPFEDALFKIIGSSSDGFRSIAGDAIDGERYSAVLNLPLDVGERGSPLPIVCLDERVVCDIGRWYESREAAVRVFRDLALGIDRALEGWSCSEFGHVYVASWETRPEEVR